MVGAEHVGGSITVPSPPQFPNRRLALEQRLGGGGSKTDDELRLDDLELAFEVSSAVRHLDGLRLPIPRWTAFQHVEDEHLLPGESAGFDDLGEELAGTTYKRLPRCVLVGTWSLSEETEPCRRITASENGVGSAVRQVLAAVAPGNL